MKTTGIYGSLLSEIETMFVRVSLSILHKRIDGYHRQCCQTVSSKVGTIKEPLLECIDGILLNNPIETTDALVGYATNFRPDSEYLPEKYNIEALHVINKDNVSELSRYFKSKNREAVINDGIEKKLEHSTWEHIHAIVRHARQGEQKKAKIHAVIADAACKELAHFMEEDGYRTFVVQIEKYLSSIKSAILH